MAFELFLRIDGLDGESTDSAHPRWIELLSFDQQFTLEPRMAEAAATVPSHLCRLEKLADAASPKLALACCSGQRFDRVIIEVCQAGAAKRRIISWTLGDATIASFRCHGRFGDEASTPTEDLLIVCRGIEWSHSVLGRTTGQPQGNVVSYWDFDSNTGG